jgi:hypothetical protein
VPRLQAVHTQRAAIADRTLRAQRQLKIEYVTERYLEGLAQQVRGLNLIEWIAARNDPETGPHAHY